MNKFLVLAALAGAGAGIALGLTPARAADTAPARSVAAAPVADYDAFTGWFAGAFVGGAWGKAAAPGVASLNTDGFVGGGLLGYRQRVAGNIYLGLFTELAGGSNDGTLRSGGISATYKNQWYGDTTAQIGTRITPDLLVYASGGVAYGGTKLTVSGFGGSLSADDTRVGWAAGVGAEYNLRAINLPGNLRVDWKHVDLGDDAACVGVGGPVCIGLTKVKYRDNPVTVGWLARF